MPTHRLFVALPLPSPIIRHLAAIEAQLRRAALPVRWEAGERLHITMFFLGATAADDLPRVIDALHRVVPLSPPASLELGRVGGFPSLAEPHTVWAGISGDTAAVERLQAGIRDALVSLGFPGDTRPFHPHVTLGRVRRDARRSERREIGRAMTAVPPPPAMRWHAGQVILFESIPAAGGVRYLEQATIALGR